MENCENCRFWELETKDTWDHIKGKLEDGATFVSSCRRYPPPVGETGREGKHFVTAFPLTCDYEWCGEFQSRHMQRELPDFAEWVEQMPYPCRKTLRKFNSFDEICAMSAGSMLAFRDFGYYSLRILSDSLKVLGLQLKN